MTTENFNTFIASLRAQGESMPELFTARPTGGEIIEHLATYYGTSEDTVPRWLVDLVKELEA